MKKPIKIMVWYAPNMDLFHKPTMSIPSIGTGLSFPHTSYVINVIFLIVLGWRRRKISKQLKYEKHEKYI